MARAATAALQSSSTSASPGPRGATVVAGQAHVVSKGVPNAPAASREPAAPAARRRKKNRKKKHQVVMLLMLLLMLNGTMMMTLTNTVIMIRTGKTDNKWH